MNVVHYVRDVSIISYLPCHGTFFKRASPMSNPCRSLLLLLSAFLFTTGSALAQFDISGIVSGTDGAPLPGAAALIIGTENFAIADAAGRFTLKAKPGDLIKFSFLGYQDFQLKLGNETELNISLTESIQIWMN